MAVTESRLRPGRELIVRSLIAAMVLFIAACGSSGDNSTLPAGFQLLTGGGTTVDGNVPSNCLNCSLDNELNAIDGNLNSAASFFLPGSNASVVSLRATAQSGLVFPAGTRLAVSFSLPNGLTSGTLSLNAFLNNTLVDSFELASDSEDNIGRPAEFFTTAGSSGTFNALELSFNKQSSSGDTAINVFGFATN